jgi:CRP/FNR family cyclic AMP-dependent transcriptional regulator
MEGLKMSMLSNLELIRRVPLFALLTANQAEAWPTRHQEALQARRDIVEQGEKSNTLFIILTGRVRVVTSDKRGREVILATLHPGDYIGEMSLIDNEPHSATVPRRGADRHARWAAPSSRAACPRTARCRTTS